MTQPSGLALTGAQYDITAGDYRATITELGAGLRRLSYRGRPAIVEYEADEMPPAGAGQLLAPWPNRVDGGRYTFQGVARQLDLSEPAAGNAIHGLTRWHNWQPAAREASLV
ncbi:MAG: aldose 1-epimerase family protein, partial [Streptosporangiaceae bacterium]